ncbi:arginyltransferase [Methylomonas sp. AM2-LC]|uniref:arginyltransferase n=1 Tax=Methylomonas sp. AM2-LC TaxID=3153301 RepID=UPI0032674A20
MISIPLWLSVEHECSYLSAQMARSLLVSSDFSLNTQYYSELIAQGFRRSGDQVYRPYCQSCQACIPTRLAVKDFLADRKQIRCAKKNADTQVVIKPPVFDPLHFDLYQRYQTSRHHNVDKDPISCEDYLQFLSSSWCKTWFVEFWINQQLVTVAVVDLLDNALSAVYTFFDPDYATYSPGVFAVLWQIQQAKQLNLDFVYLGFWIKNCQKMSYKNQYQPLWGLIDQQWQIISD